MLSVPKRANDAMHVSMLEGLEEGLDGGSVSVTITDLCVSGLEEGLEEGLEVCVSVDSGLEKGLEYLCSADITDLWFSDVREVGGVREAYRENPCKFRFLFGGGRLRRRRAEAGVGPQHQAGDPGTQRSLRGALREPIPLPKTPNPTLGRQRSISRRETSEDADSLGDASSQPDTVSIASRTSQNTADSDKLSGGSEQVVVLLDFTTSLSRYNTYIVYFYAVIRQLRAGGRTLSGGSEQVVVLLDFTTSISGELSVKCGQTVELLERSADRPGWCLIRTTDQQTPQEGLVPMSALCLSHSHSAPDMEGLVPPSTTSTCSTSPPGSTAPPTANTAPSPGGTHTCNSNGSATGLSANSTSNSRGKNTHRRIQPATPEPHTETLPLQLLLLFPVSSTSYIKVLL
ncbi:hypothetical protein WMY93_032836 [Mugilogobius chulae]|uniref:SH3 domain-containing protein n=1 Tax=Mugilogobius chulae TaxID=88201 RepID=A0AAW0MMJ1_9GOBI